MKIKIFISTLLLLIMHTVCTATVYVKKDYTGLEEGSKEKPYNTIQEAVDTADNGEIVFIWPGEYREEVKIFNKTVILKGYSYSNTAIIAPRFNPALYLHNSEGSKIMGLHISHESGIGEGIRLHHSSCHIYRNIFENNTIGVLLQEKSSATFIEQNTFEKNRTAIRFTSSYGKILNNLFKEHVSECIHINGNSVVNIYNNLFIYNDDYALKVENSAVHVFNNTIAYNQNGIDINLFTDAAAVLMNNLFAFNSSRAVHISTLEKKQTIVEYNNFFKNGDSAALLNNNISVDPHFYSPQLKTFQGFYLRLNSPCLNAGHPSPFQRDRDNSRNDIGFTGGPEAFWRQ